jgi:cell division septal protein FtsQ
MTRPWLRPNDKGIYICEALEDQIQARMQPEAQKPRGWLREALWGWLTILTGIGVGLALVVAVMLVPVIWAARKMRRVWR